MYSWSSFLHSINILFSVLISCSNWYRLLVISFTLPSKSFKFCISCSSRLFFVFLINYKLLNRFFFSYFINIIIFHYMSWMKLTVLMMEKIKTFHFLYFFLLYCFFLFSLFILRFIALPRFWCFLKHNWFSYSFLMFNKLIQLFDGGIFNIFELKITSSVNLFITFCVLTICFSRSDWTSLVFCSFLSNCSFSSKSKNNAM